MDLGRLKKRWIRQMIDQPASIPIIPNNLCCNLSPKVGCWACGAMRCNYHYYQEAGDLHLTHIAVPNDYDHRITLCTVAKVYCCGVKSEYLDIVTKCTHGKNPNEPTNVVPKVSDAG